MLSMPGRIVMAAKTAGAAIMGAFAAVKEFVRPALEFVVGLAVLAARGFQIIWAPIGAFFERLWGGVRDVTSAVWSVIAGAVSREYQRVLAVWAPIGAFFGTLWAGVVEITAPILDRIVGVAQSAYDSFTSVWSSITGFFSDLWSSVASSFTETFGAIIARIEAAVAFVRGIGADALAGGDPGAAGAGAAATPGVLPPMRQSVDVSGQINVNAPEGRAEVSQPRGQRVRVALQPSGSP
jgi:phage-related protein